MMRKRGVVLTPPDFSGVDWKSRMTEFIASSTVDCGVTLGEYSVT